MRKIILSIVVASTLGLYAAKSNSAFFFPIGPINDYLRLAKEQLKTLDGEIIFTEKMEQAYEALEKTGILGGKEVDEENAMWANKSARNAKRQQELQRLDLVEKSIPAFMPCGSVTNSILMKHIGKNSSNFLKNQDEKNKKFNNFLADDNSGDGQVNKGSDNFLSELTERLDKSKESLNGYYDEENSEKEETEDMNDDSYIGNASILLSSDEKYDTLTQEQKEAMEGFVLLVAPPYISSKSNLELEKFNKELKVQRVSSEIKHNMVNQVFNRLLSKKVALGESYPSEIKMMRENVKEVYFNKDKATETIAFKISKSNLAMPSSIIRTRAVLVSNEIDYAIREYEEKLNQERVAAQLLLEKLRKIDL